MFKKKKVTESGPKAAGTASPFKNLRVGHQIRLIGLLALVGFIVVGVIFFDSTTKQAAIQETQISEIEGVRVVEAVKYGFLNARRAEKDFLSRLNMKYVEKHAQIVDTVLPHFAKLKTIHAEPDEQTLIDEMQTGFLAYAEQFNKVVGMWQRIGFTPSEGLRGEMREAVGEVEKKLAEFEDIKLTAIMLMIRRHEKDFLLRKDLKYDERHEATTTEFYNHLAASTLIPDNGKPEIKAKLGTYMEKFDAMLVLFMEEVEDKKVMSSLFAEVAPKLEYLAKKGSADADAATAELLENSTAAFRFIMATIVIVTLIVVAIAGLVGRGIVRPIANITGAMGRLAEKDMDVEIPAQGWRNEIGEMSAAVVVFKENMIKADQLAEEQRKDEEARSERAKKIEQLCDDFDLRATEAVKSVAAAATEMQSSSESMSATAEETSQQSAAVASASDQASANVQTVASAAEELSSSISEISRQVGQSSEIASNAVREAEHTNQKVQGLAEAANKIGEVVALITDIADQTNLLALNATIEAARAGDAGKGFAVVASEVKNLANQTGKATDEIGNQITDIQAATQEAVSAIEAIGKTISEVDEIATTIASAVEEQGAATQEIARNVEQAAAGTQEVSSNISGVNQAASDTGAAATQIQASASELSQQSELLRTEVDKFLTNVRAA
ncbi:MAG: HAMP domain-containing protein [Rhodospirillales bacterium]|nr:HAMP domain-containing protein [Rhodospirillales bacterium]